MNAGRAFTRFQVIIFLSLAAENASFPVGCSAKAVTPALCLYSVFSTCQDPILTTLMELSSLAVSRWAVGPWVATQETVPSW